MIRIEFWNGQTSKKNTKSTGGLVTTDHNPCLWTNESVERKPWRVVYVKAMEYLDLWKENHIDDTSLLHSLRYVAYGYNHDGEDKRTYDNEDVIWPGNLTIKHKPRLTYKNGDEEFTLNFAHSGEGSPTENCWVATKDENVQFYWN